MLMRDRNGVDPGGKGGCGGVEGIENIIRI